MGNGAHSTVTLGSPSYHFKGTEQYLPVPIGTAPLLATFQPQMMKTFLYKSKFDKSPSQLGFLYCHLNTDIHDHGTKSTGALGTLAQHFSGYWGESSFAQGLLAHWGQKYFLSNAFWHCVFLIHANAGLKCKC